MTCMKHAISMRTLLTTVALLAAFTTARADLRCSGAYYRAPNASLHLFLSNNGNAPVTVSPPVVNGFDTAGIESADPSAKPVLWYRCRPNPIPPGGLADLTIVLAEPTDKPASIEIAASDGGRLTRVIPCVPERMRFQAVRFHEDLRVVEVFVRCTGSLRAIRMDGRSVAGNCSPWPARSLDGLVYVRINLPKPVLANSFHIFEVETDDGLRTASQVRAIPAEFLIGVYGSPSEENIKDWAAHGCNHYLSFASVPPDLLDLMAASGLSVGARYIPQPLTDRNAGKVVPMNAEAALKALQSVAAKPNLLYHHLVDEPDVADYWVGKSLGASAMELAGRAEFWEEHDPGRYTFIQLDNTFRPRNYRVYGEAADVLATHRYSVGSYLRSEAGTEVYTRLPFFEDLLDTLARLREVTEPRPFFMVPQFFNVGPKRSGRPPTIEEMRLQCYAMVAEGASGVIHYIHSGSGGGAEGGRCKPLWDAMTALHAELKRVGEIASVGSPAPPSWAKSSTPNVRTSLLVCGDRMAVVLINKAHRTRLEGFIATPMRDVTVSVRIPPWMGTSRLEVVPADASTPIPAELVGDELRFTVDEVRDARCFLICPKSSR